MTTCGVGGWGGPLPGDPSNVLTLTAIAAFGGIDLTWVYPATNPYAVSYLRVFRGSSADYASAVHLVDVTGTYYFDKIPTETTYYYWVQVVSINGTILDLVGPSNATSKLSIEKTIQELTGVIDRGLLATALKTELDQISALNVNLAQEVFDRETGETSLAEAMEAVALGLAEAHTFIIDETNTRAAETSAIAEQIDGVVATLGDDIAAATTTLTANIDAVSGIVDAMVVTKLTVNGLVGGFGVYNDGVGVEAGFDVDKFWIGRTNADKIKPFIVTDDVVYMNTVVIKDASIESAKINTLSADKLSGGSIRGINVNASSHTTVGSYISVSCAAGAGTVYVKDTTDFPSSGTAVVIDSINDRDSFTYTGKTIDSLTGCSGVLAHLNNATIIPLQKAMVIDKATNEMRFFGNRGDAVIEELASIGITGAGPDSAIGVYGSTTSQRIGIDAKSLLVALTAHSQNSSAASFFNNGAGASQPTVRISRQSTAVGLYIERGGSDGGGNSGGAHMVLVPQSGYPTGDLAVSGAVAMLLTTGGVAGSRASTPRLCFFDGSDWRFVHDNSVFAG